MKVCKYLIGIFTISALMVIVRIGEANCVISIWWSRFIQFCFFLCPALLAWIIERRNLKDFCNDYLLSYQNVNWQKMFRWVFYTAISYSLLVILFISIGGNLLGIDAIGRVVGVSKEFTYMGINFNGNSLFGITSLLIANVIVSLCYGVTLGALTYIGEEIGWRGFLERHLTYNPVVKSILVGLIWTLWGLPFYKNGIDNLFTLLAFNIVFSFYLSEAVGQSRSVWTAAAIRGVVSVCWLSVIEPAKSDVVQLGTVLCIVAVMLVVSRLVMRKNI